ncbi:HU family DNA-binding protein [Lactobacillus sp.]|uniref:HU family DNA-binding protein n=1 Tax=Lactobacillus sp. TaxID=1591 RepID=UPI00199B19BD|nr:HU family DNA-binding protein [Lactobacillus sp.]MBD5430486.1 HU family DNA-binding protein [Lactobacillus sp.]MBD5430780.1 HU family DNA-binding protein [Lactobacillus sp.]
MSVSRAELAKEVSEKTDLTQKQANEALNAVLDTIKSDLASGENVQLIGFGSFVVRNRATRKGRNPQTGEEIEIPATKAPAFKAGKALKDAVKN